MRTALDRAVAELAKASPLDAASATAILEASRDILAPHLDVLVRASACSPHSLASSAPLNPIGPPGPRDRVLQGGSSVSDNSIFRELAAFWEEDFLKDMDELNVRAVAGVPTTTW